MRVLNNKIDFSKFDDGSIRQNEIWLPTVKFQPGLFTDQGFRFQENEFSKSDHWFPGMGQSSLKFYDVTFFSSDQINVPLDFKILAEMYFRIKSDAITHERTVFSIMDWLGAIGGIEDFLM